MGEDAPLFLGIEIGGTKLQLAVGPADGSEPRALRRHRVVPDRGAEGIRQQVVETARELLARYPVKAVGVGFGGPVDMRRGETVTSHQIAGWDRFPLRSWLQEQFALPAAVANDCDTAALAESRWGAGRNAQSMFYTTVGSGIGGGLVLGGRLYHGCGNAAAEIGHLRPGPLARESHQTVESLASGWGLTRQARQQLAQAKENPSLPLWRLCQGEPNRLDAQMVFQAAAEGDPVARQVVQQATRTLGWALAQVITLLAPEVVVLGGGVVQAPEELFFGPVVEEVGRYVFPPLAGSYRIEKAALGQQVVLYGALALAQTAIASRG